MNQFAILMTAFTFFCVGASFSLIYAAGVISDNSKIIKKYSESCKKAD